MASTAERLATVRQVYRHRGGGRTAGDIAYAFYAGVLVTAMAGVPAINALVQALMNPDVVHALEAPDAGQAVAFLVGVGLVAFAALGAVRGPALVSPFMLTVLASNDLPRHRTLLRPFAIATIVLTISMAGLAVLLGSALVLTGTATAASCAWFTLAVAVFGVLASVIWLAGQRLGSPRAWTLSTVILAATLLTWAVPASAVLAPWGWLGLLWPAGASGEWWPLVLLAATTLAATGFVPRLLNSLSGPVLLEQAHRWQAAEVATAAADLAGTLATYRAKPRLGRTWRAVTNTRLLTMFFLRDLTGTLRSPGRFVVGTAFLLLGGFVTALAFTPAEIPAWIPTVIGAGVSYAAVGVMADGFRHAADTAAAPPLYRYNTAQLYGLHAILPTLWAIAFTIIGASFAPPAGAPLGSPISVGFLAIFLVAVRAYDSAKGQLPAVLLTPIPTPGGDVSGVLVMAWQADALLIATITSSVTLSTTGRPGTAVTAFAVATLAVVALTRKRLRRL